MNRNLFYRLPARRVGWWQRDYAANRTDYAAAVVGVGLLLFGIFGPVARGAV